MALEADVTGITRITCRIGEKDGLWLLPLSMLTIWRIEFGVNDMMLKLFV